MHAPARGHNPGTFPDGSFYEVIKRDRTDPIGAFITELPNNSFRAAEEVMIEFPWRKKAGAMTQQKGLTPQA